MGAEDEVDGIVAQPVLRHAHLRAKAAQLVAIVARLVKQAERMDVARRLLDANVNVGYGIHRGFFRY